MSLSKSLLLGGLLSISATFAVPGLAIAGDQSGAQSAVQALLLQRHFDGNASKLEAAAGGKDALVSALLSLRHSDSAPFVAMRAERILVDYADRGDVAAALASDVQDPNMKGLARTVVLHLDKVPSDSVRQNLARLAVTRGRSERDFAVYTKTLESSKDSVVRSIALGK